MESNDNLIQPKLASSRAGYLQKVSRKTGRSRWRKVKRGTKLVKLTATQHNKNDIINYNYIINFSCTKTLHKKCA